MPNLTLVVWNIETFGDQWDATRGTTYLPVCIEIGRILHETNADIFFMMELRNGGGVYLPTLQMVLNTLDGGAVWEYDYIPGSVLGGQAYPIAGVGQLGYTQAGHSEGYAVFWRPNANFDMLATRVSRSQNPQAGNSYIDLVFEGRAAFFNGAQGWFNAPNFNPAAPPVWGQIDFPEPNPVHAGDVRWDLARRPAYCVVDILSRAGQGRAAELLPIMVYHAPNSLFSTCFGVQMGAYSSALYQVDDTTMPAPAMVSTNQAIAGGDFNLDWNNRANDPKTDAYFTYQNAFALGGANQGGAAMSTQWVANLANATANTTAIHLSDHNGIINTNNPDDYRWLAIDNIFSKNAVSIPSVLPAAPYHGAVYNPIGDFMTGNALVNTPAKQFSIQRFRQAILNELALGGYIYVDPSNFTPCKSRKTDRNGNYVYSGWVVPNLLNYNNYMLDLWAGDFSNARRAAEFYFNSISDHLPVVYRFTV